VTPHIVDHHDPSTRSQIEVVAFDADDTLWRNEEFFRGAEDLFMELVGPYVPDGVDLRAALTSVEVGNIPLSGYGVKAFGLSMVECAVTVTAGRVPASVIGRIVDHVHDLLRHPVEILNGVPETLAAVGATHRVVLITKGDLVHQTRKVRTSGLEHHFEHVAVVLEKDPDAYRRLLSEWDINPATFAMIGNSVRSDVLPVVEIGGFGIHVPYHLTWHHETVDDPEHSYAELGSIRDVPAWLAGHA